MFEHSTGCRCSECLLAEIERLRADLREVGLSGVVYEDEHYTEAQIPREVWERC